MKNKKAKKLMFHEVQVFEREHAQILDLLLSRFLGSGQYKAMKHKKKLEWKFKFWATPKEIEILESLFTEAISPDWDDMYESLLKEVES